jgi:hypothetical protein
MKGILYHNHFAVIFYNVIVNLDLARSNGIRICNHYVTMDPENVDPENLMLKTNFYNFAIFCLFFRFTDIYDETDSNKSQNTSKPNSLLRSNTVLAAVVWLFHLLRNVADPGCLSRIPNPNYSIPDPGSRVKKIPDPARIKEFNYF